MERLEHGIGEKPFDINEIWAKISDESNEIVIKTQDILSEPLQRY